MSDGSVEIDLTDSDVGEADDVGEWIDDTPTRFYDQSPRQMTAAIPLIRRTTPVPLAEGVRRRAGITLEFRDLLVCGPWGISAGIVAARFGIPLLAAMIAAAGFGVFFDRVLRRWV